MKLRPIVISLFDITGYMVEPWAKAGCLCYCFDLNTPAQTTRKYSSGGRIVWIPADLTDTETVNRIVRLHPSILFSFPPCTDLAVSGAAHFSTKLTVNQDFQHKAVELAKTAWRIAGKLGIPWFAENPRSALATLWCPPDWHFNPSEYGGYLPENDVHPAWPQYIPPRDTYDKLTYIWCGNGFLRPPAKPVRVSLKYSPQYTKLGGRDKHRALVRSSTPRGFSLAVFHHHKDLVM